MTDTAKLIKVAELLGRRAAVTNPALRRLAKKARLRRPLDILIKRAAAPAAATAKAAAPAAAAFGQGRFGKGLKTTGRVGGLLSLGTMLGAGGLGLYNWLSKPKQQAKPLRTPYEQAMFARMNINPEQYSQEFDALRDFFQGQQMKNWRQRYLNAQLQQMAM
jgi:hypothetical protein